MMKEIGIVNRHIAAVISEQGHGDLLMVTDAGFAIPREVEVIDISLTENKPKVLETLPHDEIRKMSEEVKAIIRTGDFTAYGNVILVSGAGDRWYLENKNHQS
jgi:D-ribose pyranase